MKHLLKRLQNFLLGRGRVSLDVSAGARQITLTNSRGNQLSFTSDQPEKVGTRFNVKVSVRHERVREPDLASFTVEIIAVQERAGGGSDCQALMVDAPENVVYLLERQFNDLNPQEERRRPTAPGGHELRQAQRKERTFQVMSPNLRLYKAIALDISRTGVRLQVEASQAEGDLLNLTMDFDLHRMRPVEVTGEVMWCRIADDARTWQLGVRFLDVPAPVQDQIDRYLTYLDQVEEDWQEGRFPIR